MAITATTLTNDLTSSALKFAVGSTTGFAAGQPILIDSEFMYCVSVISSTLLTVRSRGAEGTAAASHDLLANVLTSATFTDFPAAGPGQIVARSPDLYDQVTLGEDGALAVPVKYTNAVITKGSACLFTLAAPSKAANGVRLTITSQTAFAHVLTATTLLENGLTGSPFTTATFGAFIGSCLNLVANNGVWNVTGVMTCVLT